MKKRLILVFILFIFVFTPFEGQALSNNNISKIFKIESYKYDELNNKFDMVQYGSSIYVENNIIYTNAHVILDKNNNPIGNYKVCKTIDFKNKPKCFSIGKLLYFDVKNDLAALKIYNTGVNIIKENTKSLKIGDIVKVYGYPNNGGNTITYTEGKISGYDNGFYKIDANIDSGNSGGGAFDNNGNLIGMVVSVKVGYTSIGYIIPISKINDFKNKTNISNIIDYNKNPNISFYKYFIRSKSFISKTSFSNSNIDIKSFSRYGFSIDNFNENTSRKLFSLILKDKKNETNIKISNSIVYGKNNLDFNDYYLGSYKEYEKLKKTLNLPIFKLGKIKLGNRNAILSFMKNKEGKVALGLSIESSKNNYLNIILRSNSIKNKSFLDGLRIILKNLKIKENIFKESIENLKMYNLLSNTDNNLFNIEKTLGGIGLNYTGKDYINISLSDPLEEKKSSYENDTLSSLIKDDFNYTKDILYTNDYSIKQATDGSYYFYHFSLNNKSKGGKTYKDTEKYYIGVVFLDKKDNKTFYRNEIDFTFDNIKSKQVIDDFLKTIKTSNIENPFKLGELKVGENLINKEEFNVSNNSTKKYIINNSKNELNKITPKKSLIKKNDNKYCSVELSGVTYKLDPCNINMSMNDGEGDQKFKFKLIPSDSNASYSFSIYGYGEGFPTYGILGGASSGGATGTQFFTKIFTDSVLDIGNYNGYLKIFIYDSDGLERELRLNINLDVK